MATININDTNYYYELHGQGYPLIFVNGYCSDHQAWIPLLEKLSQQFQILIFDNRGIGLTKDNNSVLTAEVMANDIAALMDKLGLQKPHLIGQSMGGTIAQYIAAHYPHKINKLVLLNTTVEWRKATITAFQSSLTMREKNVDFDFIFDAIVPWLFGQAFLSKPGNVEKFKEILLKNPNPQSLFDQQRQFNILKTFSGADLLHRIQAETLIGYGKEDLISLHHESEFLRHKIANSSLIGFQCAHIPHVEIPKELTHALTTFFA